MRKTKNRPLPVWLLGVAGPTAKRVRAALGEGMELKRFEARDLPGQTEYDREEPLAVFVDLGLWREMLAGRVAEPAWLRHARRVLMHSGESAPPESDEALSQGFLACLTPPLSKGRIRHALDAATANRQALTDIAQVLDQALRERDNMAKENGRLAFFQNMLAQAMQTLDLGRILSQVGGDLGLAFPVTEVMGVFWGSAAECDLYIQEGFSGQPKSQREAYLLELAARLRGVPARGYLAHGVPPFGLGDAPPAELGRALLVPLHHEDALFGCLAVCLKSDLARHEQETVRLAVHQVSACLKNALDYARLKRRADRDGLTGLANRRAFDARISAELKRHMRHKEGFALLLADMDHFKAVNDTHGHQAGDAALRLVAQIFQSALRTTDTIARYGGEEFAMILPHTGQPQAWMLAERLRRDVAAARLRHAGQEVGLSVSIGVANFAPGDAHTEASLIAEADQALYAAKAAGRNQVAVAHPRLGRGRMPAQEAKRMAG